MPTAVFARHALEAHLQSPPFSIPLQPLWLKTSGRVLLARLGRTVTHLTLKHASCDAGLARQGLSHSPFLPRGARPDFGRLRLARPGLSHSPLVCQMFGSALNPARRWGRPGLPTWRLGRLTGRGMNPRRLLGKCLRSSARLGRSSRTRLPKLGKCLRSSIQLDRELRTHRPKLGKCLRNTVRVSGALWKQRPKLGKCLLRSSELRRART